MSAKSDLQLPSDRMFGIVFAGLFSLIAGFTAYRNDSFDIETGIFAVLALTTLGFTALYPQALRPLNIAWMTLGMWLGKIVSPLVLGLIFFVLVTPLALVLRLLKRDELSLRRSTSSASYWKPRDPTLDDPGGLNNQF